MYLNDVIFNGEIAVDCIDSVEGIFHENGNMLCQFLPNLHQLPTIFDIQTYVSRSIFEHRSLGKFESLNCGDGSYSYSNNTLFL